MIFSFITWTIQAALTLTGGGGGGAELLSIDGVDDLSIDGIDDLEVG